MFNFQQTFTLTWNTIKKNKLLFIGLVILQIILVAVISWTLVSYQIKILENSQGILQPLQGANYNTEQLQAGQPFLPEFGDVYSSYVKLKQNVTELVLWLLGFFLIGNGLLWVGTHQMYQKGGWKELAKRLGKYVALGVTMIALLAITLPLFLTKTITDAAAMGTVDVPVIGPLIIVGIAYYLFLIGVAHITLPWKETFSSIYRSGIKKIHHTIPVLLLNVIILAIPLYVIYDSVEKTLGGYTVLSILAFIILLVYTRMVWITSLRRSA